MTKEQKQLLLTDLCARLPYGVKIGLIGAHKKLIGEPVVLDIEDYKNSNPLIIINSNWLPYLRPMPCLHPTSSMTEEEKSDYDWFCSSHPLEEGLAGDFTDWLNAHHFDYRGLIPMGLALEAPEGMYEF